MCPARTMQDNLGRGGGGGPTAVQALSRTSSLLLPRPSQPHPRSQSTSAAAGAAAAAGGPGGQTTRLRSHSQPPTLSPGLAALADGGGSGSARGSGGSGVNAQLLAAHRCTSPPPRVRPVIVLCRMLVRFAGQQCAHTMVARLYRLPRWCSVQCVAPWQQPPCPGRFRTTACACKTVCALPQWVEMQERPNGPVTPTLKACQCHPPGCVHGVPAVENGCARMSLHSTAVRHPHSM